MSSSPVLCANALKSPPRWSTYTADHVLQLPRIAPHVERGSMDSAPPLSTSSQITSNGSVPPPASEPYVVNGIPASSGATFGVDLGEQLARDGKELPKVVEKCAKAIETFGLESMGIYRLSGTTSRVQALKAALDMDVNSVDVMSDTWSADILSGRSIQGLAEPSVSLCGICSQVLSELLPLDTPVTIVASTYSGSSSGGVELGQRVREVYSLLMARTPSDRLSSSRERETKVYGGLLRVWILEELLPPSFGPDQQIV